MAEIACYYNIQHFHEKFAVYTCCLYKKEINRDTKFFGPHLSDRDFCDVRGIALSHCEFLGFPRNLTDNYKNLDHISVSGGLKEITRDDLANYKSLKFLDLQGCEISSLPGDLFADTPNLEVIYFSHNKITAIDGDILEPLKNLKYLDFTGNPVIDAVYDEDKTEQFSLDDMKRSIRNACGRNGDGGAVTASKIDLLRV